MESNTEGPTHRPRWPWRAGIAVLCLAAAVAAFAVHSRRQSLLRQESAAAEALRANGALVVMDSEGVHAASVNVSMLQTPDALAPAILQLPALTHLKALDLSRTPVTDEQLDYVAGLTDLNSLSLNATNVSDDGAARLQTLSKLESLYLASTRISDRSVPAIAKLAALRILDLSDTKVSGNLEPLGQLGQLDWLVLRNLELSDSALAGLACPGLKQLSLEGSTVSDDALAALQKRMPKLSIDR
jgi:hypothetical protein